MKTIFASLCFLFTLGTSQAQIVPQTRTLGGNLSAVLRSREVGNANVKALQFGVQPVFGKFLNHKWLLETRASYGYSNVINSNSQVSGSDFENWNHLFGIGIGLTRAFPISESFYFTIGADISTVSIFNGIEDNNEVIDRNQDVGFSVGVSPGLMYFISPRWIVSGQFGALQYQYFTRIDEDLTNQYFGFQFSSFASSIGVRYVLGPKGKRVR